MIMGNTNGYELSLSSANKVFVRFNQQTSSDTYRINSTTNYPTDGTTWIHAAATYDGSTIRLYINGVQEGSDLAMADPIATNSLPLALGWESGGSSTYYFQGVMDDVRVYKRALSASEIQALYGTMPPSMPTAPLPANQAVGVVVNPGIGTEPPNFVHLRTTVSDPDSSNLTVRFYGREYCEAAPSFSLVALPDTQYYSSGTSSGTPTMFYSQTQWIVNNQAIRNIAYATHLGDIVNTYSTGAEWEIAGKTTDPKGALTRLDDAGIPYGLTIGNHDGGPSNTANFNSYFPSSRVGDGHYGSDNDNHYGLFSASGLDFIVIQLEYNPTPDPLVLAWADHLLDTTYPTRRGIVVFHDLIASSTALSTAGQTIYDALKHNPNLFLMLGGHMDTELKLTLTDSGHTIYALRSDYQTRTGGNGWLRLMEFQPSANQIQVYTYSPFINQWETDSDSQFALPYSMGGAGCSPFGLIETLTNVPSGSNPMVMWGSRLGSTTYEWYTTVSDGTNLVTSPIWSFTTQSPTAVSVFNFSAQVALRSVQVSWQSANEVNLLGFNVWRAASPDGERAQLNQALIPAKSPGQNDSNFYEFSDESVGFGQRYSYWVEVVSQSGAEMIGPENAQTSLWLFLPFLVR